MYKVTTVRVHINRWGKRTVKFEEPLLQWFFVKLSQKPLPGTHWLIFWWDWMLSFPSTPLEMAHWMSWSIRISESPSGHVHQLHAQAPCVTSHPHWRLIWISWNSWVTAFIRRALARRSSFPFQINRTAVPWPAYEYGLSIRSLLVCNTPLFLFSVYSFNGWVLTFLFCTWIKLLNYC